MAYYINLTTRIKGQSDEMTTLGQFASRTEAQASIPLLRDLYPGRKYILKVSHRATTSWYQTHGTIKQQLLSTLTTNHVQRDDVASDSSLQGCGIFMLVISGYLLFWMFGNFNRARELQRERSAAASECKIISLRKYGNYDATYCYEWAKQKVPRR